MHGCGIGVIVSVALGVKRTVFRIDAHDTVRCNGKLLVHDEGYRISDLYLTRVDGLDIYYRAHMICRFHRARQHRIDLKSEHPCADEQQGYDDHDRHQHSGYNIPCFLYRFSHKISHYFQYSLLYIY